MEASTTGFEEQHCLLQNAFSAVMDGDDEAISCAMHGLVEQNRNVPHPERRMAELSQEYLTSINKYLIYSKAVIEALMALEDLTNQVTEQFQRKNFSISLSTDELKTIIAEKSTAHFALAQSVCDFWSYRVQAAAMLKIDDREVARYKALQTTQNRQGAELLQSSSLYVARTQSGIRGNILDSLGISLEKPSKKKKKREQSDQTDTLMIEFSNVAEYAGHDLFNLCETTQDVIGDMLTLYDFIRAYKEENLGLEEIECEEDKRSLLLILAYLKDEITEFLGYSRKISSDMISIPGLVVE